MKALFLALLVAALALACAAPVPTPIPTPTPNIPATVTARVAAIPTATPYPTLTPWPTATPRPTVTPYPTATPRPTLTPWPTHTPYPTVTPDIRYEIVTPTPEPTLGPLANWVTHSFRSVSIDLPFEFTGGDTTRPNESPGFWFHSYSIAHDVAIINVDGYANSVTTQDLYGVADIWLDTVDEYLYDEAAVMRFEQVSPNVLQVFYRVTSYAPQYCDGQYKARFFRGDTHAYAVTVFWCNSVGWKYGEDFADRVLNSFTY